MCLILVILNRLGTQNIYLRPRLYREWNFLCWILLNGDCNLWLLSLTLTIFFTNSMTTRLRRQYRFLDLLNWYYASWEVELLNYIQFDFEKFNLKNKTWNAGTDFLAFRPSEISAAVALSVLSQEQAQKPETDEVLTCYSHVIEKVKKRTKRRSMILLIDQIQVSVFLCLDFGWCL